MKHGKTKMLLLIVSISLNEVKNFQGVKNKENQIFKKIKIIHIYIYKLTSLIHD